MTDTETLNISGLLDPACYPHPCSAVQLVETHISWVLLTGQRAYKIKKPVDFGFVDFTTLSRRRHYCQEELRLNRRLAPNLYLDVIPITGTLQQPQIGGDGCVIDYAVVMRQFDQNELLSRQSLTECPSGWVDDLADQCATLHRNAACSEPTALLGSPDRIMLPVRENFDTLRKVSGIDRALVDRLQQQAEDEFQRLQAVFDDRKRNGKIRECHGDLHLGNMFLHDNRVTVFDGIEFNDDFRWIDVINEIAFTIMDLEARDAVGLANRFLNRWLERTGDYAGLQVLPFYCAYRAVVRAKVDAIRLHQSDVSTTDRRHFTQDCQGYLQLAERYGTRGCPWLAITMGPSGSGKTTVTQQLIATSHVVRVRSDVERKRRFGLLPEESSSANLKRQMYSTETTAAIYDRLAVLATDIIRAGFPVVVDATFLKRVERQEFQRLADTLRVPFFIITCSATQQALQGRIRQRQGDASEADERVLAEQLKTMEPLTADERLRAMASETQELADVIQQRTQTD